MKFEISESAVAEITNSIVTLDNATRELKDTVLALVSGFVGLTDFERILNELDEHEETYNYEILHEARGDIQDNVEPFSNGFPVIEKAKRPFTDLIESNYFVPISEKLYFKYSYL